MSARSVLLSVEALLRAEGTFAPSRARVPWRDIVAYAMIGAALYGLALGSFNGRALQMAYSCLNVPLLLACTTLLCLPSVYAINAVLGLADDFRGVLRGALAAQATVGIALGSCAPLVCVAYSGIATRPGAIVCNGLLFAVAAAAGQATLLRHYRPLIARDRRHVVGWLTWILLYVFVAIQLAWVLRPFVGTARLATTWMRGDAWGNAYVYVLEFLQRWLGL